MQLEEIHCGSTLLVVLNIFFAHARVTVIEECRSGGMKSAWGRCGGVWSGVSWALSRPEYGCQRTWAVRPAPGGRLRQHSRQPASVWSHAAARCDLQAGWRCRTRELTRRGWPDASLQHGSLSAARLQGWRPVDGSSVRWIQPMLVGAVMLASCDIRPGSSTLALAADRMAVRSCGLTNRMS